MSDIPDVKYALILMDCWARGESKSGPSGACKLAAQVIRYQSAEIERLTSELAEAKRDINYPRWVPDASTAVPTPESQVKT